MEKIYSEQFLYYAVNKEYLNWAGFEFTLDRTINKEELKETASRVLRKRYPYLLKKLIVTEKEYLLDDNTAEIEIYDYDQEPQFIFGPGNNDYIFRIVVHGAKLGLYFFHGLADGRGFLPFAKTLLFEYFNKTENRIHEMPQVNSVDSPINAAEYADPFIGKEFNDITAENAIKKPEVDVFRIPEEFDSKGRRFSYRITLPAQDFMKHTKELDGSPNVILALFLANAILTVHPEASGRIVPAIAVDYKTTLNTPLTHLSAVGVLNLHHSKRLEQLPLTTQATSYRGMVFLQSDEDAIKWELKQNKLGYDYLSQMPTVEQRKAMATAAVQGATGSFTFSVSYAGKFSFGEIDNYVKSVYSAVDMSVTKLFTEINCIGDTFFINIMQGFENECYIKALTDLFEKEGIAFQRQNVEEMVTFALDHPEM